MKSKMIIILVLGLVLLGFVTYGTAKIYADESSNWYPPIIQKLVERFGLNEGEVKEIFDEARQEHQTQMQARFEERLNQAMESGNLTEEQKELILAKHEELRNEKKANWESFKNMTPEERRQMGQDRKAELQAWAEENEIDPKFLFFCGGFGGRGGHFGKMGGKFSFGQ